MGKERQSSNHILMIEPAGFYDNPQTKETNSYQTREEGQDRHSIQTKALLEFRTYRDLLVEHGVQITTVKGSKECPDDIFPNWFSTHPTGQMVIYPMMYENRQKERRQDIIDDVRKRYNDVIDFSALEQQGKALESTSSVNLDHLNQIAYLARSPRSDEKTAQDWCKMMGYELFAFDTEHNGMQVYHTDVVLWIGSELAGLSVECLKDDAVIDSLKKNRKLVTFTNDQMAAFAGNALEVVGKDGEKMLAMSRGAWDSLRDDQKQTIREHYSTVIKPDLSTIEYYGGGSARCMLAELF